MAFVVAFSNWLKSTELSWAVRHFPWIWPASETLHFMGLAMLIGAVGLVDLRMLGVAKGVPFAALHKLVPWGIAGFVINTITGILFFAGDPFQYINNIAFGLKILFILLAGLNMAAFYLFGVFRTAEALGPGDDAPLSAKVIAGS